MLVAMRKSCLPAIALLLSAPAFAADFDGGRHHVVAADRPYDVRDVAIALAEQGFVEWDDIEFRKGVWRVDDARRADGREYDLKLDAVTLAVVAADRD